MSNKKEIVGFIKEQIKQNTPKSQIENELSSKYERKEYEKILKDFPEPSLKEKYKLLNNTLIACVSIMTLFKLLTIVEIGSEFGVIAVLIFLVIGLLIPIYLVIYLLQYRRGAYIITIALTVLSLRNFFDGVDEIFTSGNWLYIGIFFFGLILVILLILIPAILLKKLWPKQLVKSL
ncbi:MAG: hypothetical protein A2908_01925 [Candidatus Staskawiczbacteria bacterium RIFCSPLOWO2_01_FULL_38_12b]|uniref:Uncharacterized protein n=1 Tax=Candidatus Staskawiczbacteria bacterium RIFCSPLOWO2_01_FULL_38_12b TaxID=1802214 RepID=A0A1G2IED3_9BACT|nr:MAG: hypothetical protein A2908_01925 [Candidatus Staskawiczbacteria bacterium RIFCSPLOWO2_01_FULL_38_12b]QBM02613.1 hypothetical protein [uncultured archaeon]